MSEIQRCLWRHFFDGGVQDIELSCGGIDIDHLRCIDSVDTCQKSMNAFHVSCTPHLNSNRCQLLYLLRGRDCSWITLVSVRGPMNIS